MKLVLAFACGVALYAQGPSDDFRKAMQFVGAGQFAEAEQILRLLEKSYPREFEVRYRLGLILLRSGKAADALERLDAAARLNAQSPLAWIALAQARLKTGNLQLAMDAADRAADLSASDTQVSRSLAMFYTEAGRAYRTGKDPAQAVAVYQKAIRLAPGDPKPYHELAALLLDHRTLKPALAVLNDAVVRFPVDPEFQRMRALAYYQTGDLRQAISAFLAAVDLAPDSETAHASLENLLAEAGPQLAEIVQRLRSFRERHSESPVGHFLLARALKVQGAAEVEIEALLRRALEADSTFWPAHYELGQLLAARSKPLEAAAALARAVTLNPKYAPAHYSLAQIYTRTGDRARAVEHRKIHHELVRREREAAEQARLAQPTLPYRLEGPNER